jgi:hypothetical protein
MAVNNYEPTSVITLDTSNGTTIGTPFLYAVANGYTRDWQKYFSSQPLPYGVGRITGIDNGPGINQYTLTLFVTTWPANSLPYQLGVTQTWDVQKANLENSFEKVAPNNALVFLDPFGVPPTLDPTIGIYFWKFTETIVDWSTPQKPFIQYEIVLTQTPPGTIV